MSSDIFIVLNIYLLLCILVDLLNFLFGVIRKRWVDYYHTFLIFGAIVGVGLAGASILNGDIFIFLLYVLLTYFFDKRVKALGNEKK